MRPDSAFRPRSYQDWLNEINFSSKPQEMVHAGNMAGRLASDKKTAQHDIALVLAEKYRQEMVRAGGNVMVTRGIKNKYQEVARDLFKSDFGKILNYIRQKEPGYDPKSTKAAQGSSPLGFIKAKPTHDDRGHIRAPLGFIKKPNKVSESGHVEPGLGFLDDDAPSHGTLGFL